MFKVANEEDDLTVNSIVMIVCSHLPCAVWPVGNVTAVIPGADGIETAGGASIAQVMRGPNDHCVSTQSCGAASCESLLHAYGTHDAHAQF